MRLCHAVLTDILKLLIKLNKRMEVKEELGGGIIVTLGDETVSASDRDVVGWK